jgi:RNA polymerase sigma factor (sigma-70 family)
MHKELTGKTTTEEADTPDIFREILDRVGSYDQGSLAKIVDTHEDIGSKMVAHETMRYPRLTGDETRKLSEIIQVGLEAREDLESGCLTAKETSDYTAAASIGVEARNLLVLCNQGLVRAIAKKYVKSGLELSDRIQLGTIGLMKAADKFDPERGVEFSTFASFLIRGAIGQGNEDTSRFVRLNSGIVQAINKLYGTIKRLSQTSVDLPTLEDIATEMGISVAKVKHLFELDNLDKTILRLEQPLQNNGADRGSEQLTLGDVIPDDHQDIEEKIINDERMRIFEELQGEVHIILEKYLPPTKFKKRNTEIFEDYYFGKLTLEKLGDKHGISGEACRQAIVRAKESIKQPLRILLISKGFF